MPQPTLKVSDLLYTLIVFASSGEYNEINLAIKINSDVKKNVIRVTTTIASVYEISVFFSRRYPRDRCLPHANRYQA